MARHDIALAIGRRGTAGRIAVLLLAGLSPIAATPATSAQNAPATQSTDDHSFAAFIAEASQRFRIPADWIRAVLHAESQHVGDVSSAGAIGLMQIMPDTWSELRARYGLGADPFDPHDNIIAGAAYLREMLDRYGNIGAMLAAYNAGPSRYDEYFATGRSLPAETRDYVAKLAPILGGQPLPEVAPLAPSHSTDWRDAPLFVAVAGSGSSVDQSPADGQSAATPGQISTNDDTAQSAPTTGLFVPVGGPHLTP